MSTDERLPEGAATLAMRRCALQALYQLDAGQSDDVALVGTLRDDGEHEETPANDIERGMALAALVWEFRNEADREIASRSQVSSMNATNTFSRLKQRNSNPSEHHRVSDRNVMILPS